jgi:RNA polymerase sigma-70 factor (ECF subfamily)
MKGEAKSAQIETRFDAIVEEYGAFLRSVIARLCPKDLGIQFDDVEQEARLRLWRALASEREILDLASYLYRIAATATIDAVRRVKARREQQLCVSEEESGEHGLAVSVASDPDDSPERAVEQHDLARRVVAAVETLAENRRRCVRLHLEGFTTEEIANLMNWTEPKARNLVYRGLKDLRERLRAAGIDYETDRD